MPGPIMTAARARTVYGSDAVQKKGGKMRLQNSSGKTVTVSPGTNVYNRGNGKFGLYSSDRDDKRHSRGAKKTLKARRGIGTYRQTGVAGFDKGKKHKK